MTVTNEKVPFRLFAMPCCNYQVCWVNPRIPNYCPGCGKLAFPMLKTGKYTVLDAPAWLRIEEAKRA